MYIPFYLSEKWKLQKLKVITIKLEKKPENNISGNIIGSGIFITPGSILGYTKSIGLSLIVWIGCGILSLLGRIS